LIADLGLRIAAFFPKFTIDMDCGTFFPQSEIHN
jgi:hypothetical protein